MTAFSELFTKYSCTYCQEDIVGVRVHCADCVDFELCPQVSNKTGQIQKWTIFADTFRYSHMRIFWNSALLPVRKSVLTKMITAINSW